MTDEGLVEDNCWTRLEFEAGMILLGMVIQEQKVYLELESKLKAAINAGTNTLVLTLPGLSVSHFIKRFLAKNPKGGVAHILRDGEKLAAFNILDLDFERNSSALDIADRYFRSAVGGERFWLVLNMPYFRDAVGFKGSFISNHLYSTYYFPARDTDDLGIFAREINQEVDSRELGQIYELSGGIGRIAKYLLINRRELDCDLDEIVAREELARLVEPVARVVASCSSVDLRNLKITNGGVVVSQVLNKFMEKTAVDSGGDELKIYPDLTFSEFGVRGQLRLTREEKLILQEMMANSGMVVREKIAEIKWGSGSYEEFSDQAINKTMQRLRNKLVRYAIEVIPKEGFLLKPVTNAI